MLALSDISKTFVIECAASGGAIGAVLMQEARPIAFLSKGLAEQDKAFSTYEKELPAIVYAITKWRHYFVERHFKIQTDHRSLKYMMDQRISTPTQQKWFSKLMGYDYGVVL